MKSKRKERIIQQNSDELKEKIIKNKQNTGSPLDFTYEQSVEYLKNLPEFLKKSYFATELRKKWNL